MDVANRGGDADTNAAIAGALLGAFWGEEAIPARWRRLVLSALVSPRALPHILPPRPAMPAPAAPPEAKAQPRDKDRNADKEQPKEEGRARHGAERQAQPR